MHNTRCEKMSQASPAPLVKNKKDGAKRILLSAPSLLFPTRPLLVIILLCKVVFQTVRIEFRTVQSSHCSINGTVISRN